MERRIYVACLASYNAGVLHGAWIDVESKEVDEIQDAVDAMLKASKVQDAEEWAIHDYEGFGAWKLSEHENFDDIVLFAELCADYGDDPVYAAFENFSDLTDVKACLTNGCYCGQYDDAEDYARSLAEDTGLLDAMPENLRNYFDFEAYGRDMVLGGDIWISDNGHVFLNQ